MAVNASVGNASCSSFVSCMHTTSGCRRSSHSSTRGSRALSEFTFQLAIRIGGEPTWLRDSLFEAELRFQHGFCTEPASDRLGLVAGRSRLGARSVHWSVRWADRRRARAQPRMDGCGTRSAPRFAPWGLCGTARPRRGVRSAPRLGAVLERLPGFDPNR